MQVEWLHQLNKGNNISARSKGQGADAKVRTQGAKVRASISASRYGMQQQHATTATTTSDWIGPAQHDAAISATCVRAPISSYPAAGGGGCSCMLLLHPVLTSADAGPDLCTLCPDLCTCTLTFALCAYGVSLLSTGATIPLAQVVVITSCNLPWWCFILQPVPQIVHLHTWWLTLCNLRWWCFFIHALVQILHLHSGNLHCVVVVCVVYMYISVKMAALWGSLTLLCYYSLCPHLRSHSIESEVFQNNSS